MTRPELHPLDLVSLVAGLLGVVLAGLYLLADLAGATVTPALVAAVAALAVGAGVLLAAARRLRRG